jgi:hypothetical protein
MVEASEVIERLCRLVGEVYGRMDGSTASDCFCGRHGLWGARGYGGTIASGYRNDGRALEFVEETVRAVLATGRPSADALDLYTSIGLRTSGLGHPDGTKRMWASVQPAMEQLNEAVRTELAAMLDGFFVSQGSPTKPPPAPDRPKSVLGADGSIVLPDYVRDEIRAKPGEVVYFVRHAQGWLMVQEHELHASIGLDP